MPIVRLSRDKRGLDTVYLIDTESDGRRPSRARVLYFWSAPPGLRVGLDTFDAARRQAIEDAHPQLDFNWDELTRSLDLARQQVPIPGADARREGWRSGRVGRTRSRSGEDDVDAVAKASPAPPPTESTAPTTVDNATSEDLASATSRVRRRRRRGRRPGPSDASSSGADL